ncbi:MAG: ATP-binding protein [Candidatus Kapaibacteriota bacterium]
MILFLTFHRWLITLFAAALVLHCAPVFSQQTKIDSLENRLTERKVQKPDSSTILLMCNLSKELASIDPSKSLEYARKAVALADSIKDKRSEAFGLERVAIAYRMQAFNDQALEYSFQMLRIAENLADTSLMARALSEIGSNHAALKDITALRTTLQRSMAIATNDSARQSVVINSLGVGYFWASQYDSALVYFRQAAAINQCLGDKVKYMLNMGNIAWALTRQKKYDEALPIAMMAYSMAEKEGIYRNLSQACIVIAEIFEGKKNYPEAEKYAKQAFTLAQRVGVREMSVWSLERLGSIAEQRGDLRGALQYHHLLSAFQDSIKQKNQSDRSAILFSRYESERRERELNALQIQILQKEKEQQALWRNSLVGGVLFALLLLGLAVNRYRTKQRAEALLKQKQAQLELQAAEIQSKNIKLEESYKTTQILSDIGREIASSLNIETVFAKLYERVNLLMDADGFVIGLVDKNQRFLHYTYIIENGQRLDAAVVELSDTSRLSVQCYHEQREILDNDRITTAVIGFIPHSVMFVPLIVEDRCIGILSAQAIQAGAYKPHHLTLLSAIASTAATALDNAAAYKTIEEQSDLLQQQAQEIQITNTALQEQLETLRRTQTQLAQAEKMASLGTLVAGVAHELNTPIGVAVTAASTLHSRTNDFLKRYREGGLKKSELEAYLETAQIGADLTLRNMQRAADLIQSFKRVAVDQTSDERREFNLGQYLYEIVTSLQPMLKGRGAQIMVSVPSDISLRSYPGALSQIITNLVQNSVKHGFEDYQADAVMTITVKSPKGKADDTPEVVIEFADNGRGIPEAILPRIFDPFFTTKPGEQGGTGLGLNIVYNLVTQKLGGKLQCFSEINVGTRFIMTLPLAIKA